MLSYRHTLILFYGKVYHIFALIAIFCDVHTPAGTRWNADYHSHRLSGHDNYINIICRHSSLHCYDVNGIYKEILLSGVWICYVCLVLFLSVIFEQKHFIILPLISSISLLSQLSDFI